jgi:uncharacterized membrane protein (DUF373 family)
VTRFGALANRIFTDVELVAYVLLGVMLAFGAVLGLIGAASSAFEAAQARGTAESLLIMIDRLLFVLMVIEILHTVRVSFRSGSLVCEPFLVVGLIASIRRVLVITLESSQASKPGNWSADSQALFNASMIELSVLAGLILIMVIAIVLLRRSAKPTPTQEATERG